MLKFIWGKGHPPTAERIRVQKELFDFQQEVRHGFPHKPSCMAWDPQLRLLAIATKNGSIRVFGAPGVEFCSEAQDEAEPRQLLFVPGRGQIILLSEKNILALYQLSDSELKAKSSLQLDAGLRNISAMCLDVDRNTLILGTEIGSICFVPLDKFRVDSDKTLNQSKLVSSSHEFKLNPGAIESLLLHPVRRTEALIGFGRGLIVHFDLTTSTTLHTFTAKQQLECLAFSQDGTEFVSVHNDGSFITWTTDSGQKKDGPNTPFGPYPCKAINKVAFNNCKEEDSLLVFSGGMPRASYGDKFTVTLVKNEEDTTVFDLTSKVVDFELLTDGDSRPDCLIILAEEELIVIDLQSAGLPVFELPYLNAIHSSAITALEHVSNVSNNVIHRLLEAKKERDKTEESKKKTKTSNREWPINGGYDENDKTALDISTDREDMLITGHEDGSVKLWTTKGSLLIYLGCVECSKLFQLDDDDLNEEEIKDDDDEEEWPPFRRVGHYDPYSDDPRLAVKRIVLSNDKLVVGLTAGQVCVFELSESPLELNNGLKGIECQLVTETEGFTWKGHDPLTMHKGPLKAPRGFQASFLIQVKPPASINALALNEEWGLIAAGTAHGLVLVDSVQQCQMIAKCTLNAQEISNADDNPWSRRKSLKKSLRESFRRLRKGRSQRIPNKKATSIATTAADPIKREIMAEEGGDFAKHVALDKASKYSSHRTRDRYIKHPIFPSKPYRHTYKSLEMNDSRDVSVDTLCTLSTSASEQRARDKGVQTEMKMFGRRNSKSALGSLMSRRLSTGRAALSLPKSSSVTSSLSLRVPEWYWSGHPSVPNRLHGRRSVQSLVTHVDFERRLERMKTRLSYRASNAGHWMRSLGHQARSISSSIAMSHLGENESNGDNQCNDQTRVSTNLAKKPSILNQVEEPSRNAVKLQIIQQVGQTLSNVVANESNEGTQGEKRLWDPIKASINERKRKRELEKMWTNVYLGMCNRATVLNDAVEKARKEELEIRPVHSQRGSEPKPQKEKQQQQQRRRRRRECVGLEKQFYDLNAQFPSPSSSFMELSSYADDILSPTRTQRLASYLDLSPTERKPSLKRRSSSLPLNLDYKSLNVANILLKHRNRNRSNSWNIRDRVFIQDATLQSSVPSHFTQFGGEEGLSSSSNDVVITISSSHVLMNKAVQVDEASLVNHCSGSLYSRCESPELRQPVERQIEARTGAENGSMVRCLHFANTFIANGNTPSYTLWAGTNSGQVLAFIITVATKERRKIDKSTVLLGKEIQLRHKAPVIAIQVVDSHGLPVSNSSMTISSLPHRILIASEEQFKTFVLPALKPACKYKLTAHEGARIRAVGFSTFVSKSDKRTKENCLLCLTNQGDVVTHCLPELRRQVQTNCIRREDVIAIASLVFTNEGEAFYQCSSSEIQRVTMAANKVVVKIRPKLALITKSSNNENRGSSKDVHNETVVSDVSVDITVDSVKDHTNQDPQQAILKRTKEGSTSSIVTTKILTSSTAVTSRTETIETSRSKDELEDQDRDSKPSSFTVNGDNGA